MDDLKSIIELRLFLGDFDNSIEFIEPLPKNFNIL